MILAPLAEAPFAVQLHVATVLPAAVLGAFLLARPKGTPVHRLLGRLWIGLMVLTSVSSFFIHTLRIIGPFSPIHLLSILTLVSCVQAVQAARRGDIGRHRALVLRAYGLGIGVAGLFTLVPGRIMHAVVFSGGPLPGLLVVTLFVLMLALPLVATVRTAEKASSSR